MPQFHHASLENGLQVIAELDSTVQSVAFGFFVRAGSRDETDEIAGVSHFLEHMAFKGTEKFSAADVNRVFDEVGAIQRRDGRREHDVLLGDPPRVPAANL